MSSLVEIELGCLQKVRQADNNNHDINNDNNNINDVDDENGDDIDNDDGAGKGKSIRPELIKNRQVGH